jgi:hypothetical protein
MAEPITDAELALLGERVESGGLGWRAGAIRLMPNVLVRLRQSEDSAKQLRRIVIHYIVMDNGLVMTPLEPMDQQLLNELLAEAEYPW